MSANENCEAALVQQQFRQPAAEYAIAPDYQDFHSGNRPLNQAYLFQAIGS